MTTFNPETHIIGKVYDLTQENVCAMLEEIDRLKKENRELKQCCMDMFSQECGDWVVEDSKDWVNGKPYNLVFKGYHHGFISAYEGAQELLLKLGLIKDEECQIKIELLDEKKEK